MGQHSDRAVTAHPADKRVLILMMPFSSPEFPGLGPTLIRSICVQANIATDIVYGNLVFSKLVEADPFVETTLTQLAVCEIAFTPYYFDVAPEAAADSLRQYVLKLAVVPEAHTSERFLDIVRHAGQCIDTLFDSIPWDQYDVVGFSLLMGQTVASLAMARRIKQAYPHIVVIMGGANTQAPMGDELVRSFPEVDYVLQGEADGIIVPFLRELRAGRRTGFSAGGVLWRGDDGQVCRSGEAAPFENLDGLPIPDFSDFFGQMERLGLTHVQPYMPIETSRGCWWGEKHHCTFCGIDDTIMVYRSKAAPRVLEEILALSARHDYTEFFAVDSIINFKFFNELLPTLGQLRRKRALDLSFFFESKSNISRDQARRFRYGGVNNVQPGLESFSDHVLELMNKGSTGVRQVQCLKLLDEQSIVADWNLIFANPGEQAPDYEDIADLIPFIHHLPPLHPGGLTPMQINRFAPYHNDPQKYGIRNVRPKRYYRSIYPDEAIDLDQLAFYFDCDFECPPDAALEAGYDTLKQRIDTWHACWRPDSLVQQRGIDFLRIVDRRQWHEGDEQPARTYTLDGVAARIFAYCNDVRTLADLQRQFREDCDPEQLRAFVAEMAGLRLIYMAHSGQLVALPVLKEADGHFRYVPEHKEAPPARRGACGERTVKLVVPPKPAASVPGPAADPGLRVAPGLGFHSGHGLQTPAAPVRVDGHTPQQVVDAVLEAVEASRCFRVMLAGLGRDAVHERAVLDALAERRGRELLGFELECVLAAPPTPIEAMLMREAGMVACSLAAGLGAEAPCAVSGTLRRLEAARSLGAAGIAVDWHLDPRLPGLDRAGVNAMLNLFEAAQHLPPPQDVVKAGPLAGALADWRAGHRPRTLTYARGPSFLRLFDRRGGTVDWRFITLGEVQGDILVRCDTATDLATLCAEWPGHTPAELRRYLDALVEQGVVYRGPDGRYLNLAVRRKVDERWASGDR